MVDHEKGTSTQTQIAAQTYEFCPWFFIFHRTHMALIFVFLPRANVGCVVCQVRSAGWQKGFIFPVRLPVVAAPFPFF
jgi:hypothetical protein